MSWEDAAGFVICLGGFNPFCWAGCSSPSEAEFEDEDAFPPPPDSFIDNGNADHYIPPDTDTHISPDTRDATTDSDSDTEDSTELPILPDVIHPDVEDDEDTSKPETDGGADLADAIDTEDADIFGDTTDHTDSVEETDAPEVICVPELCDNEDNDCDGLVDENFAGLGNVCELGEGICYSAGYYVCSDNGAEALCDAEVIPPQEEACDGLDNNCNGKTDELCGCIEKTYEPVTTECGEGACYSTGETSCKNGEVKDSCEPGAPLGYDDTCDYIDDDCDGLIDNHYVQAEISCGIGECISKGIKTCIEGLEDESSCKPKLPALNDASCDGKDNDCDGVIDDDYVETPTTCGNGACFAKGAWTCYEWGILENTCKPGTPAAETCDGKDNDCDKETDEDCDCNPATYKPIPTACGTGECASTGVTSCENGEVKDSCKPKAPAPNDASCDGKDNNCNGSTDEGYVPTQVSCGIGPCENTVKTSCTNGVEDKSCAPKPGSPDDPTCNGIDDDCDGAADDDYMAYQITCGIGPCEKTIDTSCTNGVEDNVCMPGTPTPEICDEIDNNCDGPIDEAMPDNDNDGKCNAVDCEIDGPLDKYLVLNCYSDPGITAKMSVDACWNDLTNSGTLPGEIAYIGIEYFNEGVSFNGPGIKLCVHPLWTDCDNSEPLPIACDHEIEFETKLLGTQYIWNLISPDPDAYEAEFHFDQTKNPDVASIQIFLFMNNAGCNYLYNAFSCN